MNHARIQVFRGMQMYNRGAPHTIVILLSVVSAANLIEDPFPGLCFRRPTPGTTPTGIQNCSTPTNPGAGPPHISTAAIRRETRRGFGGEYTQVSSYYRRFPSRLLARIYRVSPSSYQKTRRRSHSPLDNVWVYLTTRPSPGLRTLVVPGRLDARHRRVLTRLRFRLRLPIYSYLRSPPLTRLLCPTTKSHPSITISRWFLLRLTGHHVAFPLSDAHNRQ